jgi:hypothetical protein
MSKKEFIGKWTSKLAGGVKIFPGDFINPLHYSEIKLPGKPLLIGEELFGRHEILTTEGKPVFHTDDYLQAKFIIYANRNNPLIVHIPSSIAETKAAVSEYESYLDIIIKEIETDYKLNFPDKKSNTSDAVVTEIFRIMNFVRV